MFLTGCAALGLVACGNDDLDNGTPGVDPNVPEGGVAYMTVNIKDANATGRSTTSPGFEYGTELDESKVNTANFYFFNENGTYAELEAEIWRDGGMNTPSGDQPNDKDNIEHLGKNVIVLKGLKSTAYPKYMLTILNQPANYKPEATLAATAKALVNWGATANFMMTTTSYYGGTDVNHNDTYYYANELKPENFLRQTPGTDPDADAATPVVTVYVERLAAKVQVKLNLTKATGDDVADNLYELPVTVAGGEDKPNTEDGTIADTKLYVQFDNWGLNATAPTSYVSKNLDGFSAETTGLWTAWNVPSFYRSYWGKSVFYGKTVESDAISGLDYISYDNLTHGFATAEAANPVYCNEYTNAPSNVTKEVEVVEGGVTKTETKVIPGAATSVLLKAKICDKAGTALDMVLHNGVLFREEAYITYVINLAGPYYTKSETNGTVVFTKYTATTGLSCDDTEASATKVVVDQTALGALELWKLKATATDVQNVDSYEAVSVADYASSIATAQNGLEATRFNGGRMYYNVPIEHEATDGRTLTDEGYYGVVRNHWYVLSINTLKRLGHAVNNPDKVIIPPVETPEYYLGAQINILSWKVVNQNVNLD